MSEYLVTTNELGSIANSIRNQTGTSNQLTFPNDFISGINNIPELEIYSYINGNLSEVYNSTITSLKDNIFAYHSNLTIASFPNCTSIGVYAFRSCTSLTTVSFPNCASIGSYAFAYCRSLTTASFPSCTSIGDYAFRYCYKLLSLYLDNVSSVTTLTNSNAFTSTPIEGYTTSTGGVYGSIYVPSSLVTEFQSATNWTYFSDRIVGV